MLPGAVNLLQFHLDIMNKIKMLNFERKTLIYLKNIYNQLENKYIFNIFTN